MACEDIEVDITVITPEDPPKYKIVFSLVKTCTNDVASWQINFELDEPSSATDTTFGKLVAKVTVKLSPEDHPAAQSVADQKQLSDGQAAQAMATADVVKANSGNPNSPDVQASAVQILHADDALPTGDDDTSTATTGATGSN